MSTEMDIKKERKQRELKLEMSHVERCFCSLDALLQSSHQLAKE